MKKFTLFIAALFLGGVMYAQNNVSGVVVDGERVESGFVFVW